MKALKKEMILKGYNAVSLSKKISATPQAIRAWCNGKFKPNPDAVLELKSIGFSDIACLAPSKDIEI